MALRLHNKENRRTDRRRHPKRSPGPAFRSRSWRKVRTPHGSVPRDERGQRAAQAPADGQCHRKQTASRPQGLGARVKRRGKSPPPRAARPGARKTLRGARQTGKTGRLPDPGGASRRDNPGFVAPGCEAGNAGRKVRVRGMTVEPPGDRRGTKSGLRRCRHLFEATEGGLRDQRVPERGGGEEVGGQWAGVVTACRGGAAGA